MEWTYYPSTEDRYTGMIWSVGLSIYNAAEPEREDGMFEEWIFDDEAEARECFEEQDNEEQLLAHLENEEEYFNTVGVLLFCREYEDGFEITNDAYFEDTVIGEVEYSRF